MEGDDAVAVRPGLEERQRHGAAVSLEQALPGAGRDRMDEQAELVEQAFGEQEPDEGGAGPDSNVRARLLLELGELAETVRALERERPGRIADELSRAVFAQLAMKRTRRAAELVAEAIRAVGENRV